MYIFFCCFEKIVDAQFRKTSGKYVRYSSLTSFLLLNIFSLRVTISSVFSTTSLCFIRITDKINFCFNTNKNFKELRMRLNTYLYSFACNFILKIHIILSFLKLPIVRFYVYITI